MQKLMCSLVVLMLCAGILGATPVLTNGSFENCTGTCTISPPPAYLTLLNGDSRLDGWTVTTGNVDWMKNLQPTYGWVAADGLFSVDLNGTAVGQTLPQAGFLKQTVTADYAGQLLTLGFYMSGNPGRPAGQSTVFMDVRIGNSILQNYSYSTANTAANMQWVQYFYNFSAPGTSFDITFLSLEDGSPGVGTPYGPAIDGITLTEAIPEPASMVLLGGGLLALALVRRRR